MTASTEDGARALARGALVVYPTETLYALGADASSAVALDALVRVRGREAGKPVLVLIADLAMAGMVAASVPSGARRLAARFWPGPLTLVLPARDDAPAALTAGTGTVGVRVSSHPAAAALVAALGRPVTAPSVNPPGAPPARDVAEARAYFGDAIAAYVDGGPSAGGASTVAMVEGETVRVLRAGRVSAAALEAALVEEG